MIKSKFFLDEEDEVIESPKAELPKEKEKSVSDPNMKYCKKCGSENLNRVKFCGNCGNDEFYDTYEEYDELTNYKYCYKCEKKLKATIKFCPDCGSDKFMQTLEDVHMAKENSIHEEWKAKVEESRKKIEEAQKKYENLCLEKQSLTNKMESKKQDNLRKLTSINEQIALINDQNKEKAARFEYEMKDLRDKISYLRAQLSHYEKNIIDNKENMKNMDKRNIELEYELQDYEAKVSEALYRLRNAQRKAMQDYFVKCFPLKTSEVKTSNNVSYSPSNPYVYFGKYAGKPIKWRVLDDSNNELLLLTAISIDAIAPKEVTTAYFDKFMSSFNENEKRYMLKKITLRQYNGSSLHYAGLLSYKEALKYLKNKEDRMADYDKETCKVINLYSKRASWLVDDGYKRVNGTGGPGDILFPGEKHGFRPVIKVQKSYFNQPAVVDTPKSSNIGNVDEFMKQTFTVEKIGGNVSITRFNVAAKNVIIPDCVNKIGDVAFKQSSSTYINHLLIPASVNKIESSQFSTCKNLYNLVIEDGIKSIGNYAFHYANVKYLYIPDSVQQMGDEVFHWMLDVVSIPKNCRLGNRTFPSTTLVIRRD